MATAVRKERINGCATPGPRRFRERAARPFLHNTSPTWGDHVLHQFYTPTGYGEGTGARAGLEPGRRGAGRHARAPRGPERSGVRPSGLREVLFFSYMHTTSLS